MKKILSIISATILGLVLAVIGIMHASAMASIFMAPQYGAGMTSATTTYAWMTPGNATTTITLPTPLSMGMATKYDKGYAMILMWASSSPQNTAIVKARVEHSLNGVDWFSDTVQTSANATNTPLFAQEYTLTVATSSAYVNNGSGTTTRSQQAFYFETPTPYNRVVLYEPIGGQNVSVWAAVQGIKEVQVINQ